MNYNHQLLKLELDHAFEATEMFIANYSKCMQDPVASLTDLVSGMKRTDDPIAHQMYLDAVELTVCQMDAILNDVMNSLSSLRDNPPSTRSQAKITFTQNSNYSENGKNTTP